MNEIQKSWLAGLWEGEGSICIFLNHRRSGTEKLSISLTIVNTDPLLIKEFLDLSFLLGITFHVNYLKRPNPKHANCYQLTLRNLKSTKLFIETIYPFMRGKKKLIGKLALEFIDSRIEKLAINRNNPNSQREKEIFGEVKKLNERGKSQDSGILRDYTSNTYIMSDDIVRTNRKLLEANSKS